MRSVAAGASLLLLMGLATPPPASAAPLNVSLTFTSCPAGFPCEGFLTKEDTSQTEFLEPPIGFFETFAFVFDDLITDSFGTPIFPLTPWTTAVTADTMGSVTPVGGWTGNSAYGTFDGLTLTLNSENTATVPDAGGTADYQAARSLSGSTTGLPALALQDFLNAALLNTLPFNLSDSMQFAGTSDFGFIAYSGRAYLSAATVTPVTDAAPVPEPATLTLLGTGAAAVAARRRRRRV